MESAGYSPLYANRALKKIRLSSFSTITVGQQWRERPSTVRATRRCEGRNAKLGRAVFAFRLSFAGRVGWLRGKQIRVRSFNSTCCRLLLLRRELRKDRTWFWME